MLTSAHTRRSVSGCSCPLFSSRAPHVPLLPRTNTLELRILQRYRHLIAGLQPPGNSQRWWGTFPTVASAKMRLRKSWRCWRLGRAGLIAALTLPEDTPTYRPVSGSARSRFSGPEDSPLLARFNSWWPSPARLVSPEPNVSA